MRAVVGAGESMKTASTFALLFSSLIAFSSGCSKSTTTPFNTTDAGTDPSSSGSTGTGDDDDPNTPILTPPIGDDDDTGTDAGTTASCSTKTTLDTCATCCQAQHPSGGKVYNNAINSCVCAPDICSFQCSDTLCAAKTASSDCALCANDRLQGSCGAQVQSACSASTDCVAYQTCLADAGCSKKPSSH